MERLLPGVAKVRVTRFVAAGNAGSDCEEEFLPSIFNILFLYYFVEVFFLPWGAKLPTPSEGFFHPPLAPPAIPPGKFSSQGVGRRKKRSRSSSLDFAFLRIGSSALFACRVLGARRSVDAEIDGFLHLHQLVDIRLGDVCVFAFAANGAVIAILDGDLDQSLFLQAGNVGADLPWADAEEIGKILVRCVAAALVVETVDFDEEDFFEKRKVLREPDLGGNPYSFEAPLFGHSGSIIPGSAFGACVFGFEPVDNSLPAFPSVLSVRGRMKGTW